VTEGAWVTGMRELLTIPGPDLSPEMQEERGRSYRRHLDCLTDRQWTHAVAEAVRLEKWFPAVATLLEYGDTAPPMLVGRNEGCQLCEGTGFEPFERGGYAYVRFCPRGCPVGIASEKPDYRTDAEKRADATAGVERIKAAVSEREAKDAEAQASEAQGKPASLRRRVQQASAPRGPM
jgi:hypothetical protein